MNFYDFKEHFKDLVVFNQQQIKIYYPEFNDSQLHKWQKKKLIQKICRGQYIFTDLKINDPVKYSIANQIHFPSYISLDLALFNYSLIPETVYSITSVTSNKTKDLETPLGRFYYRHLKPSLMFGYNCENSSGMSYQIASIEKSVLDFLYFNTHLNSEKDFLDLRLDIDYLAETLNQTRLEEYLDRFSSGTLSKRTKTLIRMTRPCLK